MSDVPEPLVATLAWLALTHCRCDWAWRSYGKLYGISMGKGWVRTTTSPQCKHHRTETT